MSELAHDPADGAGGSVSARLAAHTGRAQGYIYLSIYLSIFIYTMGPGPGLVAHVLWWYCMRLVSSGVGGVRRVRLALWYVGVHRVRLVLLYVCSCVRVLWV